jgi:hypothetical protein
MCSRAYSSPRSTSFVSIVRVPPCGIASRAFNTIAHLDLPTATKTVARRRKQTIQEVRAALDALAEFMNAVATHFGETHTAYGMFSRANGAQAGPLLALR